MVTKEETAQRLADAHFQLDEGITHIFRLVGTDEVDARSPVKLLEINPMTNEVGISPIGFNADPTRGIHHGVIVVEVTPAEHDRINNGLLNLPHGWKIAQELFPTTAPAGVTL